MKNYPKSDYIILEKKAKEHRLSVSFLFKEKAFDACVSSICLSLINYMDALSINLFGCDNKSGGHAQMQRDAHRPSGHTGREVYYRG